MSIKMTPNVLKIVQAGMTRRILLFISNPVQILIMLCIIVMPGILVGFTFT
jgi:hypothetical protein